MLCSYTCVMDPPVLDKKELNLGDSSIRVF